MLRGAKPPSASIACDARVAIETPSLIQVYVLAYKAVVDIIEHKEQCSIWVTYINTGIRSG